MASTRRVSRASIVAIIAVSAAAPLSSTVRAQEGAQRRTGAGQPASAAARPDSQARGPHDTTRVATSSAMREEAPVVTHHTMRLGGETVRYTATTGMLPIRNEQSGETEGRMFFVAYTKDGADPATRPVSFIFNGGPGSATVWLHMGAYGPKKVKLLADGNAPPPPYTFEDNQNTLLDQTDLVFLDPVGTGYSRATKPENGPKFWGLDEDVRAVGEFIRLYLSRNERWGSPKFVSGESYGTTRAAHLSGWLVDNGIAINGVMLLSAVLNFENSSMVKGNDIGFVGFFPSYAATAWYHKKLPADMQAKSVEEVTRMAEQFASGPYATALMKGEAMPDADKRSVAEQMSRLIGVPVDEILENDLRLNLGRFSTALLRGTRQMSGRLDSRFSSYNVDPGSERTAFDPSEASIRNTFTPVLNDYVRRVLNYKNDDVYYILGGGIGPWKYPNQGQGYANVVPSLERAFTKNPYMKLYVAMGYYDMATPYYAVKYTLDHMTVDPKVRAGIRTGYFTAGHMMYIDEPSMKKLRGDLRKFIDEAVKAPSGAATATSDK